MGDRETILDEIARQQAVLDRLEQERDRTRERLLALEASLGNGTAPIAAAASPATSAEKVALFRRLFRGRDDVYPPGTGTTPAPVVMATPPPARTNGCAACARSLASSAGTVRTRPSSR